MSDKIAKANVATQEIDKLLFPPLDRLRTQLCAANGAGIYADVPQLKAALRDVGAAISRAQKIANTTEWPTPEDYDRA